MLDGFVRFVVGSFEFAVRLVLGIGLVMEEAVGEGATEALVEEQEQERDLHAFVCEPVGITAAIALEKGMTFQLAEVVAELIQAVGVGGKLEHGEYGLMDLLGGPATDGIASMEKDLQYAAGHGRA